MDWIFVYFLSAATSITQQLQLFLYSGAGVSPIHSLPPPSRRTQQIQPFPQPCAYMGYLGCRVERDATRRVRPLDLRLPSKRAQPFFGGYHLSNHAFSLPVDDSSFYASSRIDLSFRSRKATVGRTYGPTTLRLVS